MKALVYIFIVLSSWTIQRVHADDSGLGKKEKVDALVREYLESEPDLYADDSSTPVQIIIYDVKGNIRRQVETYRDIEFDTPSILRPVLRNADFITKIEGVYYYLYVAD